MQYVLTCAGSITLQQIDIIILAPSDGSAMDKASDVIKSVARAGYFNFWLAEMDDGFNAKRTVRRFGVDVKTVVTVR